MRNENLSCEECILPIKGKFLDLKKNSVEKKIVFSFVKSMEREK